MSRTFYREYESLKPERQEILSGEEKILSTREIDGLIIGEDEFGNEIFLCPNCKTDVTQLGHRISYKSYGSDFDYGWQSFSRKFCPECGQKLNDQY